MKNIRIETIAGMVQKGMVVADIGSDHAFLPITLVEQGISEKVYACDIGEGPLSFAKKNIIKAGLQNQITTILSDGLDHVPDDVQVCVIAGMGYYTATGILEKAMDRLSQFSQIIVEVNRQTELLRKWISDHHYTITAEQAVYDKGYHYIIVAFNTEEHAPYSNKEIVTGTDLLKKDPASYMQYRDHRIQQIDQILSVSDPASAAHQQLKQEKEFWLAE